MPADAPVRLRINLAAATVQGVPRPPGAEHPDAIIMSATEAFPKGVTEQRPWYRTTPQPDLPV